MQETAHPTPQQSPLQEIQGDIYSPFIPERDHPDTLTADYLPSLSSTEPALTANFLADPTGSIFYQYILRKPESGLPTSNLNLNKVTS